MSEFIGKAEAEQRSGVKLDGRRKYFIWEGLVCVEEKYTQPCSGCSCDSEYPCSCCVKRGHGCEECGYTGKRRNSFPCPVNPRQVR